ncbi:lipopolysaccharide biosynthesis protein (plasmid) [Rhizobium sp. WL3]|uniref:lipopolysaccharide biosynthesis protein n=1 Tax=Rhizobium sp. WL3 TaxID=2603277 RepID=UPI0011C1E600|nr:lipopolysaccharide biosynthesis protein [Rhizobium sp. WL3]QEE43367.1 lipopolysaccharide biosynthesis protein [Rhizobium sp. WL3]
MALVLQLVSIPVLVSAWGAENFGVWMMLTTIPTYFALTDLGFLQAATSDMTMSYARGDREQVVKTYQSTFVLLLTVCLGVVSLAVFTLIYLQSNLYSSVASYSDTLILLVVFAALSLLSRTPLAALRATGQYATGTASYDLIVFAEGLVGLLTAYLGGGFKEVVGAQIAVRLFNMMLMYWLLRTRCPWLTFGTRFASCFQIRALFIPAIAAMAIPVAMAINLQGVVLIVGGLLGPIAVASYTPVRTCSRMALQIVGVMNRASMPEIARASSKGDSAELGQLVKLNAIFIVVFLVPGSVLFGLFGSEFVEIWSNGHIFPDELFVGLVAVATFVHGIWYFISNMLLSTNSHVSLAKYIMASGIISIALSYIGGSQFGLVGVGAALIFAELFCVLAALPAFMKWARSIEVTNARQKDNIDGKNG